MSSDVRLVSDRCFKIGFSPARQLNSEDQKESEAIIIISFLLWSLVFVALSGPLVPTGIYIYIYI